MNTYDKSLQLAKLMRWSVYYEQQTSGSVALLKHGKHQTSGILNPYKNLAQFAAILLANIEVFEDGYLNGLASFKPTQENILDEILRINGVNV